MVDARFEKHNGCFVGFKVCGHAGFADCGQDIVCAAVSSALQLVVNGLAEVLKLDCKIKQGPENVSLRLKQGDEQAGAAFMEAFYLHLDILSKEYKKTIEVKILEV